MSNIHTLLTHSDSYIRSLAQEVLSWNKPEHNIQELKVSIIQDRSLRFIEIHKENYIIMLFSYSFERPELLLKIWNGRVSLPSQILYKENLNRVEKLLTYEHLTLQIVSEALHES